MLMDKFWTQKYYEIQGWCDNQKNRARWESLLKIVCTDKLYFVGAKILDPSFSSLKMWLILNYVSLAGMNKNVTYIISRLG